VASWRILEGDCRDRLAELDAESAQTCVTSPPYFGLRDYGLPPSEWADGWIGCLGLEPTPEMYVAHMVEVFSAVRRALAVDGTVWLNLGDSFCSTAPGTRNAPMPKGSKANAAEWANMRPKTPPGMKPKDLVGVPWMVAFALRADGWYLRSEIIWHKPNPMPESVTDRPTKSHEQVFLLSKGPRYFYDADAVREPHAGPLHAPGTVVRPEMHAGPMDRGGNSQWERDMGETWGNPAGRNKRSVWTVATQPYPGAHFATFPPKLIEPCILAGSPEGGTVLDPFAGAGTTGMVALRHGRSFVGIELNPDYAALARDRIIEDCPLHNAAAAA
jgi:DNA modification methylase